MLHRQNRNEGFVSEYKRLEKAEIFHRDDLLQEIDSVTWQGYYLRHKVSDFGQWHMLPMVSLIVDTQADIAIK